MSFRQWIVCEQSGRWAQGLRAIIDRRLAICELRTRQEIRAAILAEPRSLVLLAADEWEGEAAAKAMWISACCRQTEQARVLVVTGDALLTKLALEVGVLGVFTSLAELARLGSWARVSRPFEVEENSLRATVLGRIPWSHST